MSESPRHLSNQSPDFEDEIDLRELIRVLWQGKFWIIGTTFIAAVISIAIALRQPNIYRAEALLVATDEGSGGLSRLASQYGGLATLAGVNIPSGNSNQKTIGIAKLQSRRFIADFVERRNILPELMAASAYNTITGELSYDLEIFDPETSIWTRDVELPSQKKPSSQQAFLKMTQILSVTEDITTGFVTVSIENLSPLIASEWVMWLVDDLNREMMLEATAESEQSINYLTEQLQNTQIVALQQVFYSLIEEQTKTLMLANSRPEYLFQTIDPAIASESRYGPNRRLTVVLGTIFGGILSVLGVLIRHYSFRIIEDA